MLIKVYEVNSCSLNTLWHTADWNKACLKRYPDNSPPGQFAPDNSSPIFKQLAPRSFIHYRAKRVAKYTNPRLNFIQIILRSFIHYRTNYSSFFYPLPSLKIGGELSVANCPGGELSDIPRHGKTTMAYLLLLIRTIVPPYVSIFWIFTGCMPPKTAWDRAQRKSEGELNFIRQSSVFKQWKGTKRSIQAPGFTTFHTF